jgi:AcrR family transcriptional regulator
LLGVALPTEREAQPLQVAANARHGDPRTWLTGRVNADDQVERRPRDRAATRQSLLDAARALFAERGYDRTTLRQVAEKAGVDAALVARYFGGKEGLYLAVFNTEKVPVHTGDPRDLARRLMIRWDEAGPGPMVQALMRPELDEALRDRMLAYMEERMLGPTVAELERAGVPDARLRAELLMAGLVGVGVIRKSGSLTALSEASTEKVLELLGLELDGLLPTPD